MHIRSKPALLAASVLALALTGPGDAQTVGDSATAGQVQRPATAGSGAQVYRQICQGCHMPDAKGGSGAATFPALAANPRLQFPAYPVTMVVRGRGGMPSFAEMLTPDQIAEVVTYVRTNFGNDYKKPVTAEEVRQLSKGVTFVAE